MIFYLTHGYCGKEYHIHKSSKCHFPVRDPKHEEVREVLQGIAACNERIKAIASLITDVTVIVYDGLKRIEVKRC